ncbi:nose resistant to fluoxetine protein 6-like [Centruroides sculpturatus]|uniref:nose resistant to fluoxetine protein 6-like n=1 Tax=Centruroides sculpturatus TaxID=218467 RepID=UPI000C6C9485|nr:nose resistant to fluoxetine protein 6-like [Centruroides sculpturatus]
MGRDVPTVFNRCQQWCRRYFYQKPGFLDIGGRKVLTRFFLVLDSAGKASGIFSGKTWLHGDYDQCLNIKVGDNKKRNSNRKIHTIYGKFCVVNFGFNSYKFKDLPKDAHNRKILRLFENVIKPYPINQLYELLSYKKPAFRLDLCIPSTCSREDLENMLQWAFEDPYLAKVRFCKVKDEKITLSTAQIICIIALSIFITWVIIGTILETVLKIKVMNAPCDKGNFLQNLVSVSICKSTGKLFSADFNGKTSFFCGMKFLLVCVVVFVHILIHSGLVYTTTGNLFNIVNISDDVPVEISSQGMSLIETFFFLSGFLTFYLRRNEEENSTLNYFMFFIKRYLRLTFPLLCVLAFFIILPLAGEGPHWDLVYREAESAEVHWWRYILHIQNLYNMPLDFFIHLWFVNALMQLTIITVPLLYIYDRWPKLGSAILGILMVAGVISHVCQSLITKYVTIVGLSINLEKLENLFLHIYEKPYFTHLSSYCLGLLMGYVLSKKKQVNLRKMIVVSCWITTTGLIGLIFFGLHNYRTVAAPNESIIFAHQILSPIAWIVVTAWICVACLSGNGGVVNKFLSLEFFVVMDRLTLWIYLLHPVFILYLFGEFRSPQPFTEINLWMTFLLVMLLSVIASIFCYIFLQIPFTFILFKVVLLKNSRRNIHCNDENVKMETLRIQELPIRNTI